MRYRLLSFSVVLGSLSVGIPAQAGPMVTPLFTNLYQVSFEPLTFTLETAGVPGFVVFEDFFATNASFCGNYFSGTVETSVNGGATESLIGNSCTGTFNGTFGNFDPNDLIVDSYLAFNMRFGSLAVGTTIQVSTSNHSFGALSVPGAMTGPFSAFLANVEGRRLSNIVTTDVSTAAVPEPSTVALLGLGLALVGAAAVRHRHRR